MSTYIKLSEVNSTAGKTCSLCGESMPYGMKAAVWMTDEGTLEWRHPEGCVSVTVTLTTASSEDEGDDALKCPYCGATETEKGIPFSEAENPSYSLGNHKKWCDKNPRFATASEAPAKPKPLTIATPVPAPAPAKPKPSLGSLPIEYVNTIEAQRDRKVALWNHHVANAPETYFSERVQEEILPEMLRAYQNRQPVLLIGVSGTGKTVLAKHIGRLVGAPFVVAQNFSESMRMDSLFGNIVPLGGGAIGWNDGTLTSAARWGGIALLEEFTRNGEAASRAFSVFDQQERTLLLPDNPFEQEVLVDEGFCAICTANPPGLGYTTKEIDAAMKSRFLFIDANFPFADERKVAKVWLDDKHAEMLVDMFETIRLGEKVWPNTRDLVQVAQAVHAGSTWERALSMGLTAKVPSRLREGVQMIVASYDM